MRRCGAVEDVRGLGRHDHVCWPFDEHAEFQAAALSFLEDGLRLGQRISYVSDADATELRQELDPMGVLDDLIAAGTLELISLSDRYGAGFAAGPQVQADAYAEATAKAVADGYTGLRVAADASSLVVEAGDRQRLIEYEHRVDRVMADGLPLSAMCGYDRRRLDGDAVGVLACMHPASRAGDAPFHLRAAPDGHIAIAGVLDAAHGERFRRLVGIAVGTLDDTSVTIDCRELTVANDAARTLLEQCADEVGATLVHLG